MHAAEHAASDYIAVTGKGKIVAGPFKDYGEARLHADRAGGYVMFVSQGQHAAECPKDSSCGCARDCLGLHTHGAPGPAVIVAGEEPALRGGIYVVTVDRLDGEKLYWNGDGWANYLGGAKPVSSRHVSDVLERARRYLKDEPGNTRPETLCASPIPTGASEAAEAGVKASGSAVGASDY